LGGKAKDHAQESTGPNGYLSNPVQFLDNLRINVLKKMPWNTLKSFSKTGEIGHILIEKAFRQMEIPIKNDKGDNKIMVCLFLQQFFKMYKKINKEEDIDSLQLHVAKNTLVEIRKLHQILSFPPPPLSLHARETMEQPETLEVMRCLMADHPSQQSSNASQAIQASASCLNSAWSQLCQWLITFQNRQRHLAKKAWLYGIRRGLRQSLGSHHRVTSEPLRTPLASPMIWHSLERNIEQRLNLTMADCLSISIRHSLIHFPH
jgi:hypothetical protein